MIRTLLVDDEELGRLTLRRAMAAFPEFEIVGEAGNGVEAMEMIGEVTPDLVLLDIEMPGFSGFEVIRQLTNPPAIVFVTAYDEYAVQAFEANAIDYLLKPVQPDRLERALSRVRERLAKRDPQHAAKVAEIASHRSGPLQPVGSTAGQTDCHCRAAGRDSRRD
jgi:two-component system LytT family response regulator